MYSVSGGVTNVSLEYSTNGGTTWNTIVSSGGSYSWVIPNVYSTNALVRATDVSVSCNSDVSNAPFTLTSQVTVTIPNGGEVFPATVGPQGSNWVMNTITETMNTGNFYDPGGPTGNYTYTNVAVTKTFYPDVPVNKLRVAFNAFSTVNSNDNLKIYNGPSTASPLIGTWHDHRRPSSPQHWRIDLCMDAELRKHLHGLGRHDDQHRWHRHTKRDLEHHRYLAEVQP
ncbi:MAG: hypothetical protein U0176_13075 [Bacteroidia bacterium]